MMSMQIHFGDDLLAPEWPRAVVCIGTFDGVHRGHRAVIESAVGLARSIEAPAILVTFDRHPAAVLAPDRRPSPISSIAGNLRIFESLGISLALVLPFTLELSRTPAQGFFQHLLTEKLRAEHIVVGHDFAFGAGREGNPEWLAERISTTVAPPFLHQGHRISSTNIRSAISVGDFETANRLLGRAWALVGIVVPGKKLGRTLGFPTMNIARSFDQIMPRSGVYAGIAETPFGDYSAAISIGTNPTVGGESRTIEAYLLDYPGEDAYGRVVRLRLLARLRDEENFTTLEAMTAQIRLDVEQTRETVERNVDMG